MGGKRVSTIEKILHRVEDHIEEWRRQDQARQAEAEADRDKLWAEAKEREEMLAEGAREAESRRGSVEAVTDRHRLVFVVLSDEEVRKLETFASERNRLVEVVPVKMSPEGDTDITGLVARLRGVRVKVAAAASRVPAVAPGRACADCDALAS